MDKKKKVVSNLIISTISQLITLTLGLILPRIILTNWGSEYNGLINSVTTIMRYFALLEAGINTSTLQALYKSIGTNDEYRTSVIVRTSKRYYHLVSIIYITIVALIAFIYPLILNTTIPYWEIFWVIVLQGCSGVINFAFRASYQQLLNAEGKYYVISLVTLFTTICTYLVKIVSIIVFNSVIVMQLLGVVVMGIQVLIYAIYFKKKYRWIKKDVPCNMELLENRKYYIIQQIAGLVFNSTDTFVLSVFCGLKVASVYTVYNMIYSALTMIINIIRSSTNFVMGQSYHESFSKFTKIYKAYSALQVMCGCILTSTSVILIKGFISLYTKGVTDINYINYLAAVLFSINIILDCSRGASLAGANVAGQAPKTTWRYIAEAIMNLSVSLVLVNRMGLNGVLIGTLVAGMWRTIDSIFYFYKNVIFDKPSRELVYIALNISVFIIYVIIGHNNIIIINSYRSFVIYGVFLLAMSSLLYMTLYFIVYKKDATALINTIMLNKSK